MNANRDILFMFRHQMMSPQDAEREVRKMHALLFHTERLENFVTAHEVLDINRGRIINKISEIKKMLRTGKFSRPFIFFCNKN